MKSAAAFFALLCLCCVSLPIWFVGTCADQSAAAAAAAERAGSEARRYPPLLLNKGFHVCSQKVATRYRSTAECREVSDPLTATDETTGEQKIAFCPVPPPCPACPACPAVVPATYHYHPVEQMPSIWNLWNWSGGHWTRGLKANALNLREATSAMTETLQ